MIIVCNNCSKKFEIDSSLIPEKGRLLQCNGCGHRWFFIREVKNIDTKPAKINNFTNQDEIINEETANTDIQSKENIDYNKTDINDDNALSDNKTNLFKDEENNNILGSIIVFIISFIALIIMLDTFKTPIGKFFPKLEFILYNLYETINDIKLFLKDLV